MKKVNSIFIFFFLILSNNLAQFDPPEINFIGLKENWKYISYDSNFVKYAYNATPYWGRAPVQYILNDRYLFINEICFAQNPYDGFDGSLIHKIEMKTGKAHWVDFNNRYTGNKHNQLIQNGGMAFDSLGNIELIGFMSYDTMVKNKPGLYFYGRPFRRIVDYDTGDLLDFRYGKDTMKNYATVNTGLFLKNRKGQWLRFYDDAFFKDTILYERVSFFKLDKDLNIEYPAYDSILHCTNIKTNSYFMSYPPTTTGLTTDTLLFMFGTRNPAKNKILTELKMDWLNISDIDSIKSVRSVDILDDIFMPLYEDFITYFNSDGNIILCQRVVTDESYAPAKRFIWLLWYDKNGNRIAKIDYLNSDGYIYDNNIISIIGVKDNNLYFIANRKDEQYRVHDILKIEPGINKVTRIGSMKVEKSDDVTHYVLGVTFAPDEQVILRIAVIKSISESSTNYNYFYSFNAYDLGITTTTIDVDSSIKNLQIYPNPTQKSISISCDESESGHAEIFDQLGRLVMREKIQSCEEKSIDISGLSSGLYFVRLIDDSGKVTGRGKFVKE